MKFEEKLIRLRKKNALSQEELAEKLNVTRQTISKWELGQTKPDSEKLMEIAKIFNVSTDELLNESESNFNTVKKNQNTDNGKRNTIIVIILVAILAVVAVWVGTALFGGKVANDVKKDEGKIVDKVFNVFNEAFDKGKELYIENENKFKEQEEESKKKYEEEQNKILEELNKQMKQSEEQRKKYQEEYNNQIKQHEDIYKKGEHNSKYEMSTGVQSSFVANNVLNNVIKDNSSGSKKITVKYNNESYTESGDIASLTSRLLKEQYLITYGYDEDGFINEVIIADV